MKNKYKYWLIGVLLILIVVKVFMVFNHKPNVETTQLMVSLGYEHSAAIKEDGSLWIWGSNSGGQLGLGKEVEALNSPQKLMDNVKCISLSDNTSAAVKNDGSLWIWGQTPLGKDITPGGMKCSYEPINILDDVVFVELGGWNGAAIKSDGSLWMWGENSFGSVGSGSYDDGVYPPVKVLDDVRAVKLSSGQTAAIKNDGSVWMWGRGPFPIESLTEALGGSNIPKEVINNVKIQDIGLMTGGNAMVIDDVVWEWDSINYVPKKTDIKDVSKLVWENFQTAVIKNDNSLWVLQDETYVKILDNIRDASIGGMGDYYAAINSNGELYMWGNNERGQLGDGTTNSISSPKKIMLLN